MMFKNLHKYQEETEEHSNQEKQEDTQSSKEECKLEEKLEKQMKRQRRITRVKRCVTYIVIGFGLLGGYKSLSREEIQSEAAIAVNDYSFAEEYLKSYLQYPQNEQSRAFLQQFTSGTWTASYEQKIKEAQAEDVQVYQVLPSKELDGKLTLYAKISLKTKLQEGKEEHKELYAALQAVRKQGAYAVNAPVEMITASPLAMNSDMKKEIAQEEKAMKGQSCTDQEKQEITNTIQLFLTTYASDLEQARLLMQDPASLKPLDPQTVPVFESLQSAVQDTDHIQAVASVRYETKDLLQQKRTIRFTFDKKTNKIIHKEEY